MKPAVRASGLLVAVGACSPGDGAVVDRPDVVPIHTSSTKASDVAPDDVAGIDPGLRRLSRAEYERAVLDLLHVAIPPDVAIPDDPETRGFVNQGDALDVSSLLFEAYESAAARVVDIALRRPTSASWTDLPVDPDPTMDPPSSVPGPIPSPSGWLGSIALPAAGDWTFDFVLHNPSGQGGEGTTTLTLWVDDRVAASQSGPTPLTDTEVSLHLTADDGLHNVALVEQSTAPGTGITLTPPTMSGPAPNPNPVRDALVTCDLDHATVACVRELVTTLAPRALRRPVANLTIDRLVGLAQATLSNGGTTDEALGASLRALLTHPRFVFRVEREATNAAGYQPLDAWELATRLAATVWVSPPDDTLRELAASGELLQDEVLRSEVRRLLADPRADALGDVFVVDWLDLDGLTSVQPDPTVYPTFDEDLRADMAAELTAFARAFVHQDVDTLLSGAVGAVGPRLATHYGVAPGDAVDLGAVGRGGILGTAGLQTLQSHADRPSPTRRGKFVLDRLLCTPPPPPPPSVPPLGTGMSTQDLVAAHATDPACAVCHTRMDPLGLALEHFDGIGAWQDTEGDTPIVATRTLVDGTVIDGLHGLSAYVAGQPGFHPCVADKLFLWAMGREPGPDALAVQAVSDALDAPGATLADAVEALVMTRAFRSHRSAP